MAKKLVDEAWAGRLIARAGADELIKLLRRENYRSAAVFWMAAKRCDEIAIEAPSEGLDAAKALCRFARNLDSALFAMSLAILGSAHRILGRFDESRDHYGRALSLLASGPDVVRGRVLQRLAALEFTVARLPEARVAVEASLNLLDGVDGAISWVIRSKISLREGNHVACCQDAGLALKVLNPKLNQQVFLCSIQSLSCAVLSGRASSEEISKIWKLIQTLKRRRRRHRSICWSYLDLVEAQIVARLGSHRQAERQFLRVRDKLFVAGGEHFRAGLLVSIDLAVLYEECAELEKSRREAKNALEIAELYGLEAEASTLRTYLSRKWLSGIEKEIRGLRCRESHLFGT